MSERVRTAPPVFVRMISWAAAGVATRFVPKSTAVVLSVTAGPGVCAELLGTTSPNEASNTKRIAEALADVRVGANLGADLIPRTLSTPRQTRRVIRSMHVP